MSSNYKPLAEVTTEYGSQKKPDSFKTDDEIKILMYATRGTPDDSFDADSLFIIVDNIIQIIDEVIVMQTSIAHSAAKTDDHEKSPKPNFSVPLCIIKQINSEISCCRVLTVDTAHESAFSILKTLENYSSKAKAGLVLAALAIEFGDFLLFAEPSQSNQLSKSLAVLKAAPIPTRTPELIQQRRAAVTELNSLIKATFQLLHIVFELDKMSSSDPKGVASSMVDLAVYWIVTVVIACANKITSLRTGYRYKLPDISIYDTQVRIIINRLTNYLNELRSIKENGTYSQLLKVWKTPHESMKFLSYLFSLKDTDAEIIDGSYNFNKVRINELKDKTIIFFISRKNISDDDIFTMKQIQLNKIMRGNNQDKYAIVWVPVLEEGERFDEYENFARIKDMRWYIMKPVSHFLGRKFLKEEWHLKSDKTAVVYSTVEGRELNRDAYSTMQLHGLEAFPFTTESVKLAPDAADWIVPLFKGIADQTIIAKIDKWVAKRSYIFFHGGRDRQWAKQIDETINAFLKINAEQALAGRAVKITIKRLDVEENAEVKERFWRGVQGLFLSKLGARENGDASKRQVDRLYSYKSEDAWFVFNAGSATVAVGDRYTLSKVAEGLDKAKWAPVVKEFHAAFVEQHETVSREYLSQLRCSRIDIPPDTAVMTTKKIGCPVCRTDMEVVTSYVCCHTSGHRK